MRLKNKVPVFLKNRVVHRGKTDGEKYVTFSDEAIDLRATVYSKSGSMIAGEAGYVQQYQKKMLMDDEYTIANEDGIETFYLPDRQISMRIGDGVCIYSKADQEPDYRIVGIYPVGHLKILLEKL